MTYRGTGPIAAIALAVVLAVTGCATAAPVADASRVVRPPDTADSLLFVARSDHGRVTTTAGVVTLTLDRVDAVTWFSDRPQRDAGVTSVADALGTFGWTAPDGILGEDPPNATLTADELGTDTAVVEVSAAHVEGKSVTFTLTPLRDTALPDTALTAVELFIDSTSGSLPVTTTTQLRRDVYVTTTISLVGDLQVAQLFFTSNSVPLGSLYLTAVSPTGSGNYDSVVIDSATMQLASPLAPGTVVIQGTVAGDPFSLQVASWFAE